MEKGFKEIKEAEIVIDGNTVEIFGKEREAVLEFTQCLDGEETKKLIDKLESKMQKIQRKLSSKGYFFNDDIDNFTYRPEIIRYIFNNVFGLTIDFGKEYGVGGRAIYYDDNYERRDGRKLRNMAEELYNEHYGRNR